MTKSELKEVINECIDDIIQEGLINKSTIYNLRYHYCVNFIDKSVKEKNKQNLTPESPYNIQKFYSQYRELNKVDKERIDRKVDKARYALGISEPKYNESKIESIVSKCLSNIMKLDKYKAQLGNVKLSSNVWESGYDFISFFIFENLDQDDYYDCGWITDTLKKNLSKEINAQKIDVYKGMLTIYF